MASLVCKLDGALTSETWHIPVSRLAGVKRGSEGPQLYMANEKSAEVTP